MSYIDQKTLNSKFAYTGSIRNSYFGFQIQICSPKFNMGAKKRWALENISPFKYCCFGIIIWVSASNFSGP